MVLPHLTSQREDRRRSAGTCLFGVVGLDAAHVRRLLGHQDLHELRQAGLELGGGLYRGDTAERGERRMRIRGIPHR